MKYPKTTKAIGLFDKVRTESSFAEGEEWREHLLIVLDNNVLMAFHAEGGLLTVLSTEEFKVKYIRQRVKAANRCCCADMKHMKDSGLISSMDEATFSAIAARERESALLTFCPFCAAKLS